MPAPVNTATAASSDQPAEHLGEQVVHGGVDCDPGRVVAYFSLVAEVGASEDEGGQPAPLRSFCTLSTIR